MRGDWQWLGWIAVGVGAAVLCGLARAVPLAIRRLAGRLRRRPVPVEAATDDAASEAIFDIPADSHAPVAAASTASRDSRRHLRGSTLLLAGRLLSLGVNFLVQILIIRHFSKSEFGAFAWALAVVGMGTSIALLGFNRAVARYLPIYQERGDLPSLFGTLFLASAAVFGVGLAMVAMVFGFRGVLLGQVVDDPAAVGLLLILVALIPLQALDSLFQSLLAVFARPRALFFRRHVVGPALRLGAVLAVLGLQGNVSMLAWGFLAGGVLGVLVYVGLLYRIVADLAPARTRPLRGMRMPVRELMTFGAPLMTIDLVHVLRTSFAVLLLERFCGTVEVAEFRAVVPIAGLNEMVLQSFKLLFIPVAARMFVRQEGKELARLYRHSTLWIAFLTFPVFAVTVLFAEPLTVFLFDPRYADSATVLAFLALGEYVHAVFGLNTQMLQVYRKVGFVVFANVLVGFIGVLVTLLLVPRYGAVGGAIAFCATIVAHNGIHQVGMAIATRVGLYHRPHAIAYASILAAAGVLFLLQRLWSPPLLAGLVLAAAASFVLLRVNRRPLDVERTFPELLRLPGMAVLLRS